MSGEEEPPLRVGPVPVGIAGEHLEGIPLRVNADRHQPKIRLTGEVGLELSHLRSLQRAGVGTVGEKEVGHPHLPAQVGQPERLSTPLQEAKLREHAVDRQVWARSHDVRSHPSDTLEKGPHTGGHHSDEDGGEAAP